MTETTETTVNKVKAIRAGFDFAGAEYGWLAAGTAAIKLLKEAGGTDQAGVRHGFMIGYMARRFLKTNGGEMTEELATKAEVMFYAKPNGSELKAGQIARTKEWEKGHVAARAAWSRLLKAHEMKSDDKRGGARPKAGKAEGETSEQLVENVIASAPLAKDKPTAYKWLAESTGILNAFVLRNKDHVNERCIALTDQYRKDMIAAMKD